MSVDSILKVVIRVLNRKKSETSGKYSMRSTRMLDKITLRESPPAGSHHDRPVVWRDLSCREIPSELRDLKVAKLCKTYIYSIEWLWRVPLFRLDARIPTTHTVERRTVVHHVVCSSPRTGFYCLMLLLLDR